LGKLIEGFGAMIITKVRRSPVEVSMAAAPMKLPMWYRTLAVIVGVFSIALALIVLVEPLLALWLLIFFLALALLMMGIDRLVAGVTGHPFGQMMPLIPPVLGGGEAGKSAGPGTGPTPPSKP
jgi:hypothetical protein